MSIFIGYDQEHNHYCVVKVTGELETGQDFTELFCDKSKQKCVEWKAENDHEPLSSLAFFHIEDVVRAAELMEENLYYQQMLLSAPLQYEEDYYETRLTGSLVPSELAICQEFGHKLVDCSSAGPDSGDMDHACERCGAYFSIPLY